ncbi:hypothetical protein CSKR_110216 [Clonorchis sinensis]|uniref:Uncharacterized protein n=1 Tax=Clonorchis sinensis TaxID=79923 RepID=A0A3R7F8E2_CLOSI|nr:hypothetical protein CSKR_110216 [Clonorchis sinensis]
MMGTFFNGSAYCTSENSLYGCLVADSPAPTYTSYGSEITVVEDLTNSQFRYPQKPRLKATQPKKRVPPEAGKSGDSLLYIRTRPQELSYGVLVRDRKTAFSLGHSVFAAAGLLAAKNRPAVAPFR